MLQQYSESRTVDRCGITPQIGSAGNKKEENSALVEHGVEPEHFALRPQPAPPQNRVRRRRRRNGCRRCRQACQQPVRGAQAVGRQQLKSNNRQQRRYVAPEHRLQFSIDHQRSKL